VSPSLTVENGHEIAKRVQANIQEALPHVAAVAVHVDPIGEVGEEHHHQHA
jgi:divalent metal cation (Fe/Co/Zn/Cd) transporter